MKLFNKIVLCAFAMAIFALPAVAEIPIIDIEVDTQLNIERTQCQLEVIDTNDGDFDVASQVDAFQVIELLEFETEPVHSILHLPSIDDVGKSETVETCDFSQQRNIWEVGWRFSA